ncbi:transporter [Scleromatobacter humisilvae]|uniref:Transporter n=1 Tax=Scleromatobacter humisilvae TaxID=2897159 RepID=A0A9X1YFI8_9BURK|nr:transporter [Scleromatobacter humisilvae]MCK9685569.1 transporter [Scleromatobacter humisilvae]
MRSSRLLATLRTTIPAAACASAALAAGSPAFAAADDQMAPESPVAAPAGFAAVARRLIDSTVQTEREVVESLRQNVSRVMTSTWRLSLGTPYVPGSGTLVSRGAAANDATPSDESLDLSLGARWRVLHGDVASHVPSAAWMPDLQTADAHTAALRPTMSLSGEWALPNDFSLGVMPGMAVDYSSQGRRQATGTFAVTLGKTWSPQWRTFVDMARDRATPLQIAGVSTSVDAGITFVATPSMQIDFAVTRGLSDTAPPFQAGLGLSSSF